MFRALCIYLCLYLVFPPQVWAKAGDVAPAPVAALTPKATTDTRKDLRQAFSLASWKLAYLIKSKAPFLLKTHPAGFYSYLEPFAECVSPFAVEPTVASTLDESVLLPLQTLFAEYLFIHAAELSQTEGKLGEALDFVPIVHSPENKAQCAPTSWRPEKKLVDLDAEGARGYLAQAELEGRAYNVPFAYELLNFTSGRLTDRELRGWLGWLIGIREFRTLMAGFYKTRDGQIDAVPAPFFAVAPTVARKINDVIQGERLSRLKLVGKETGLLANIPHFAACANDETRWCFIAKNESNVDLVDDEIMMGLFAPSDKKMGLELNALRKLSIKARYGQMAVVNSLLQKEAVPLVEACRTAPDLKELNSYYDELNTFDKKLGFGGLLFTAAEKLESDYRTSVLATPVPSNPKFYEMGQKLANDWLTGYFKTHNFVVIGAARQADKIANSQVAPEPKGVPAVDPNAVPAVDPNAAPAVDPNAAPVLDPSEQAKLSSPEEAAKKITERREALFAGLKAISFQDRLKEAPGRATSDFSLLLGEKVMLWGTLVQEEVALIPEANRKKVVASLIEGLVLAVLMESLEAYVMGFALQAGLDLKAMSKVWNDTIKKEWEFALKSQLLALTVTDLSKAVADALFDRFPKTSIADPEKIADEALTEYVRVAAPRVKEAAQIEDTTAFLKALIEWKNHPLYNLIPNPWNYHWELAKKACVDTTPAFFFVDDGSGHGYGYTLPPPDVMSVEGYLHIIPGMEMVAEKRRDDLIKRLRARGYSDEMVRRMFTTQGARNTGVLADLVLKKFSESLKAKPHLDRGWSASERTASLSPLLKWLKSGSARLYYENESGRYANYLYKRQLRRFFEAELKVTPALESELQRIYENDTVLRRANAAELLELVKRSGVALQANEGVESTRTELKTLSDSLFETDAFESVVDFKNSMAMPTAPLAELMNKGRAFFTNEKQLKDLYLSRFQGATEYYVDDFLNTFGRTGVRFDGTVPKDAIKASLLKNLQEALIEKAWAPMGTQDPKVKDRALGQIAEILKKVSSQSFDQGETSEAILLGLNAEIATRAEEWFAVWIEEMDTLVAKVDALIAEKDPKPELYKAFTQLYGSEVVTLLNFRPLPLKERIFQKELASVLLPDFSQFREAVSLRIEKVLAAKADPEAEIQRTEVQRRELSDRRWSMLKDKDEAAQKAILATKEGKDLERDLNWTLSYQKDAIEQQRARLELRRLVRNYLPDLGQAKAYVDGDKDAKATESLWGTYVADQFYNTKTDALGKEMALSPAEVVEDLNFIATGTDRKLRFDAVSAKSYLKGVSEYFTAALSEKNLPNFTRWYEADLVKTGTQSLKIWAGPFGFTFMGNWSTPEARYFSAHLAGLRARAGIVLADADKKSWEIEVAFAYSNPENFKASLFKSIPSAQAYAKALLVESQRLLAEAEKSALAAPDIAKYWALVEEITQLALGRNSEISPLEAKTSDGKKDKVVSLAHVPSSEIPFEMTTALASDKHPVIHTTILLRAASAEAITPAWPTIFAAAKGKEFPTVDSRKAWVLALSVAERAAATKEWTAYVAKAVSKQLNPDPFQPVSEKRLQFEEWSSRLTLHVGLWAKYQQENQEKGQLFTKDPRFPDLARALFRLFIAYLPYRLVDGTLQQLAVPGSEDLTLFAFDDLPAEKRLDLVNGIYERLGLEGGRLVTTAMRANAKDLALARSLGWPTDKVPQSEPPLAFEPLFRSVQKLPGATWMVGADEQWLRLAAEENTDYLSQTAMRWNAFATTRIGMGDPVSLASVSGFSLDYSLPPRPNSQSDALNQWVSSWSKSEGATLGYAILAKGTIEFERKRLWNLYPSIDELLKSGIIDQAKSVTDLVDNLAKHPFAPGTYGYLLASLNWNMFHYGSEPPIGPTAYALPPHQAHLAKLMEELVLSLGLNLRTINGWQKVLQNHGGPEEWLAIAESRKEILVGSGDRRFLGTMVKATQIDNPNFLGATMSFRPFPIVDDTERSQLATSREYHDWAARTENPALYQIYRTNANDRPERPLFEQLAAVQGEMLGEKDLREGNPLVRGRFRAGKGKWDLAQFGKTDFDAGRLASMQKMLEIRGIKIVKEEISGTLTVREALVDFRRTVNELNLRYAHESFRFAQGRGNDIPDAVIGSQYTDELKAMLTAFAKQMDASQEPLPELKVTGDPNKSLADQRRELMGRAIYWASQLARKRAFRDRKADVVTNILEVADLFYNQEGQKIEVRRGLVAVANNINTRIKFLCESASVVNITTEKEFKAKRKLLLEESGLVMMDQLQQLMYFDSGWIKDGENSQARHLLMQMAREAADSKKFAKNVEQFVFYTAMTTLTIVFLGRSNPGAARMLLGSRAAQGLLTTVGYAAALGFAGLEIYQVYEDFWGRPEELALLTSVRDSQFTGQSPLMKDETARLIPGAYNKLATDQRSKWRWAFHLWGVSAGLQAMGPIVRWAKGGATRLLSYANPLWPVHRRFKPYLKYLGLGKSNTAFNSVAELGEQEGLNRVLIAHQELLGAKRGPGDSLYPSEAGAKLLADDATVQYESLCRQLGLNPRTMRAWNEAEVAVTHAATQVAGADSRSFFARASDWFRGPMDSQTLWQRIGARLRPIKDGALSWGTYNPLNWGRAWARAEAASVATARANSNRRLEFLRELIARLKEPGVRIDGRELVSLIGIEADPILRHTPLWMSFFGVSNWSSSVRQLRQIRLVARANLDIVALYDRNTLAMIAYMNQLSLNGGMKVEKWEIFTRNFSRKIFDLPKPVRRVFRALQTDARNLTDDVFKGLEGDYETALDMELARYQFFRDCFEEAVVGIADPRRARLVEKYQALIDDVFKGFSPRQIHHFKEAFLNELGLALLPEVRTQLNLVNRLADWKIRSEDAIRKYSAEYRISEEELIFNMLDPKSVKYKSFKRPDGFREPIMGEEIAVQGKFEPLTDINQVAFELRSVMNAGGYFPNRQMMKALADGNYAIMAYHLTRMGQREGELNPREEGAEDPFEADRRPIGETQSRLPIADAPPPKNPIEIKSAAQLRTDLEAEFEAAVKRAVEIAEAKAIAEKLPSARIAEIKVKVERMARARAAQDRDAIETLVKGLEQHKGWAYSLNYTNVRQHADRSMKALNLHFERELAVKAVTSAEADAMARIVAERTVGIIYDKPQMLATVRDSKTLPEEFSKPVLDLLARNGNAKALERELGAMRRYGKLTADSERLYRVAISYQRAMEVSEGLATTAERERLLKWILDQHLKHTERIAESPMSLAESRELLGLEASGAYPKLANVEAAAKATKELGVEASVVDRAVATLKKGDPLTRDLGDIETLAIALNVPAELMPSQIFTDALVRSRRSLSAASEGNSDLLALLQRRYGDHFEDTVDDGLKLLGLEGTPSESVVSARSKQLQTQSERLALAAEKAGDPSGAVMHRVVTTRAIAAEKTVLSRNLPGVRQRIEPKVEFTAPERINEVDFSTDHFFDVLAREYDAALVARAKKCGFGECRTDLLGRWAKGEEGLLKGLSPEEQISRLMHLTLIMNDLKAAGRFKNRAALDRFVELALEHYVKNPNAAFTFLPGEAETFVVASFKQFGTAGKMDLTDPTVLKNLAKIFAEQKALIGQGKGVISELHLKKLNDALLDISVRHVTPGPNASQRIGTEAMALHSRLGVPEDVILALARDIEKNAALAADLEGLFQYLTYAPRSGYRTKDGTNVYAELKLALFGPEGRKLPAGIDEKLTETIMSELQIRYSLAIKNDNAWQKEMIERAARRLNGGEAAAPQAPVDEEAAVFQQLLDGVIQKKFAPSR